MSAIIIVIVVAAAAVGALMLAAPSLAAKIFAAGVGAALWYTATIYLGAELLLLPAFVTLVAGSGVTAYGIDAVLCVFDRRRADRAKQPPVVIVHRVDLDDSATPYTVTVERIPAMVEAAARFGAKADDAGLLAIVERRNGKFLGLYGTERHCPGEDIGPVAATHARRRGATYVPGGAAVQHGPAPVTYVATMGPQFGIHSDAQTLRAHAVLAIGTLRIRFDHPETARSWARTLWRLAAELDQALTDLKAEQQVETDNAAGPRETEVTSR